MKRSAHGFTIVELLIVIVVIGILAAISIVAYSGVRDKASLSAVQSDLSNAKKKLMVFQAESGRYPVSSAELTTAGLRISGVHNYDERPSYANFYYCTDLAGASFALGARASDSQTTSLFVSSTTNIQPQTGLISQALTCAKIGLAGTGAADGAFSVNGISTDGTIIPWLNN